MAKLTTLKPRVRTISTSQGAPIAVERERGWELMKTRKRIAMRAGYLCEICGRPLADGEVDHKIPLHLGGKDEDENRQWICAEPCHRLKTEREGKGRR